MCCIARRSIASFKREKDPGYMSDETDGTTVADADADASWEETRMLPNLDEYGYGMVTSQPSVEGGASDTY